MHEATVFKDTLIVRSFYKFGSFMGVFPSNFATGELSLRITIVVTTITLISLIRFYMYVSQETIILQISTIIDFAEIFSYYIFSILTLRSLIRNKRMWKEFFGTIANIDKEVGMWKEFFGTIANIDKEVGIGYTNKYLLLLRVLFWIALDLAASIVIFNSGTSILIAVYVIMVILQMTAISVFVLESCLLIQKRQDMLSSKLETFRQEMFGKEFDREATSVERAIKNIYFVADTISSAFGWLFFSIFILNFIIMFVALDKMVETSFDDTITYSEGFINNIYNYAYLGIFFAMTISLAIAGDKIEKTGLKIKKLCHVLQVDVDNPIIKAHLREFAVYFEELRPVLTVSGFFVINRNMIPLLISSLTSYAVILIQLKSGP
uniref:Gustatory receptor n=1 Tax=Pyrrhalta aenescens TaxID=281545 RepID=A0A1J0KKT1_9CUCU|nr:gustatory receptor 5 [Pyrrhalta aenescens]